MARARIFVGLLIACCALLLLRAYASSIPGAGGRAQRLNDATAEPKSPLTQIDRYLTFISTDKPIYRIGDTVYVRGVMLNAANNKPMTGSKTILASINIKGPKGEQIASTTVSPQDSVWAYTWSVPEGQAGGEYTVSVGYPFDGYTPAQRKFDVRAYRAPRLNSQIKFLRDGYGPGDKVTATLEVKRAEGGFPSGAKVTVDARVDGVSINAPSTLVDPRGKCTVSFNLPTHISRGEGTLALIIEDGGVIETASKTIPILLQTVDLQMFPEGGDLIAGFKNRVYVQAYQPDGKPADLSGRVFYKHSGKMTRVTEFHTQHEGRGWFEFVPLANAQYSLKISKPTGIKTDYPLPVVKQHGAIVHAERNIFSKRAPITLFVGCTDKKFRVTLAKRDREIGARTISGGVSPGTLQPVTIAVPTDAEGVLTATVWNEQGTPLAERLIFREAQKPIIISIKPDKNSYAPGDKAKVTVKATDLAGKPVEAVVGITVTDNSILQMVEKREQAPRLPAMVFLEPEVKDLADASVYLDAKNPQAPLYVDLLLGTQGWRRFALENVEKFVQENGDRGKRAIAFQDKPATQISVTASIPGRVAMGAGGLPMGRADILKKMHVAPGVPRDMMDLAEPVSTAAKGKAFGAPIAANALQIEPTVVDERHYTSGRDERQQKTRSVAEGSPILDNGNFAGFAKMAPARRAARFGFAAGMLAPMAPVAPVFTSVRQFAHIVRPNRVQSDRSDFTETLFWNAGVKTDAKTGEASVNFGLNDSVTSFKIFADAFKNDGAIGSQIAEIKSITPFYTEAKLPLEVTAGDQILLPISLVNATPMALLNPGADVVLSGPFKLLPVAMGRKQVDAGSRIRWIQPINVGYTKGIKEFVLNSRAGSYLDKVTRQLSVAPCGFPTEKAFGGVIEPDKPIVLKITIEKNVVPQSIRSNTAVYPTPLANMTSALERMIQDPNGCFEQTSSTSYPLTMAQQYFLSHSGVDPKLVETSRQKLDVGYQKLVGFWCPDRGYEWFGENPGHEALTAFGLLHFSDMARVKDVDKNMIATTRTWLMNQKDGKGGFTRKRRALHSWIEDKDCSDSYITWALLETGQPAADLKNEVNHVASAAEASKNNYVVALGANTLELAQDGPRAKRLMDRLAAMQKPDGSVDGITSSIVGSGGDSLTVEGTALATLAWLHESDYAANVAKSIKYLADACKDGRYGSTQATVLALRAIVDYDKKNAHPMAPGKVHIVVDGQPIGDWLAFDRNTQDSLKLPDISEILGVGEHKVEISMEGGSPMPYSLAVNYNTLTPISDKECKVNLNVTLAQNKIEEGASTEANVTVTNTSKAVIPNPVAIVGLPGGLEPRHDQLKELVKKHTIDAYEVRGREVVLYWRALAGNEKVQVPISLIAAVPGSYTGPASRAYEYYTDEHKRWIDGVHIEIAAKK